MSQLQAFSGKKTIKSKYVKQAEEHIRQDNLIAGSYATRVNSHWRGCHITCLLNSPKTPYSDLITSHAQAEKEPLQFPEWLVRLEDTLHENLSSDTKRQEFFLGLVNAVPIGFSDWENIKWKFISFLMQENIERVEKLEISEPLKLQVLNAIKQCKDYAESADKTEEMREAAWSAAESAAWSAAESAAWSARSAARSAAESAAESAAWSAAESARSAASAAYDKYADYLIFLFQTSDK